MTKTTYRESENTTYREYENTTLDDYFWKLEYTWSVLLCSYSLVNTYCVHEKGHCYSPKVSSTQWELLMDWRPLKGIVPHFFPADGGDDDDDDDAADDIVADTCSLGLLQRRPGGQQIVADKKKRLSLLHWLNCVNQQINKQTNKQTIKQTNKQTKTYQQINKCTTDRDR